VKQASYNNYGAENLIIGRISVDEPSANYNNYAHIAIEFGAWDITERDEFSRSEYKCGPYRNISISAQYDSEKGSEGYGQKFGVALDGSRFFPDTVEEVTEVVKLAQGIEKRYQKLVERLGQPQSFGQRVTYYLDAIGVAHVVYGGKYGVERLSPADAGRKVDVIAERFFTEKPGLQAVS